MTDRIKLKAIHVALSALVLLLIYACTYWRERLYGDSAIMLFWLTNNKEFIIAHNRPTILVIEVIPLLLNYLHASVKQIIIGFSIGEWLWYALGTAVLIRWLKDTKAAIGLLLVYFGGMRFNYFNPVSELILAVPLIFIFFSYLNQEVQFTWKRYLITGILISSILFSHPLNMLLFPWLFVFDAVVRKRYTKPRIVLFVLICLLWGLRYFLLDQYDRSPMNAQQYIFTFRDFAGRILNWRYIKDMLTVYLSTIILLLVMLVTSAKKRQYLVIASLTLFCFLFWVLVNVKMVFLYPDNFEPYERYLLPIPIAIGFAFAYYFFNENKWKQLLLVSGLFVVQSVFFNGYASFVSKRYDTFEMAINNAYQFPNSKFGYRKENYMYRDLSPRINGHAWVQPQESILLSAISHPNDPRQVFIKEILQDDFYFNMNSNNFLYSPDYWLKDYKDLNQQYFPMHTTGMRVANTDTIQAYKPLSFFSGISIEPHNQFLSLKKNKEQLVNVKISNKNKELLYSGNRKEKVMIAYKWKSESGVDLPDELLRTTPVQCDIRTGINQPVWIMTPATVGKYRLQWYLLFEQSNNWRQLANQSEIQIH